MLLAQEAEEPPVGVPLAGQQQHAGRAALPDVEILVTGVPLEDRSSREERAPVLLVHRADHGERGRPAVCEALVQAQAHLLAGGTATNRHG